MTQQPLITRLKAVEEALTEVLAAERATNRPPSTVMEAEAKLDRIRAAATQADAALSDLRELIKEEEGLECYGVINSDNDVEYSASYPQACHDHINAALQQYEPDEDAKNWVVRRLFFTALGEKP